MSLRDEPHNKIASSELAAWLEQQGTDRWWTVDGDPLLTGRLILAHVNPLPAEAAPLSHYNRSSIDLWNLVLYIERNFGELPLQQAAVRRHMGRLHGMILVNLVETFERYLKEVAAACVDALARY